jgi:hypothetical protein
MAFEIRLVEKDGCGTVSWKGQKGDGGSGRYRT